MAEESSKKYTLKEKIENHIGLYSAGLAIVSFVAGFGAHSAVITSNNRNDASIVKDCDWKTTAEKEGWLPKLECPSYPVELKISSPGNQSTITFDNAYSRKFLETNLIVQSSRPILNSTSIGVIIKDINNPNYYVIFPNLISNDNKTVFRTIGNLEIPFEPVFSGSKDDKQKENSQMSVWVLATNEEKAIGSIYSSLEQVKNSVSGTVISEKVDIFTKPK